MSKPIRVLVASALGDLVAPVLNQRYDKVTVVTSGEELEALLPHSLRYDVAVIDLLWNSLHLEWRYDGLDAIQQLRGADKESPVILAAQGHGFERDYLEEARDDGSVKGTLLKSAGIPALLEGIEAVSSGGRYWDAELHRVGRTTPLTVSSFFRGSELASHVAGAIASGQSHDWADVARLTGYSLHSVQKASEVFGDALYQMGEVDDPTRVRQATVFRWCGEHSRYILSWCRRNGLGMYRRSLTKSTS